MWKLRLSFNNFLKTFLFEQPSLSRHLLLLVFLLENSVNRCDRGFEFSVVSVNDVIKAFKSINIKKTTDFWGHSVHTVSAIIDMIFPHSAVVYNYCIASVCFLIWWNKIKWFDCSNLVAVQIHLTSELSQYFQHWVFLCKIAFKPKVTTFY